MLNTKAEMLEFLLNNVIVYENSGNDSQNSEKRHNSNNLLNLFSKRSKLDPALLKKHKQRVGINKDVDENDIDQLKNQLKRNARESSTDFPLEEDSGLFNSSVLDPKLARESSLE